MFGMCSTFLAVCAICQRRFDRLVQSESGDFQLVDNNASLLNKTPLPLSTSKPSPGSRKNVLDNL
jgi:hypothetical protein